MENTSPSHPNPAPSLRHPYYLVITLDFPGRRLHPELPLLEKIELACLRCELNYSYKKPVDRGLVYNDVVAKSG